MSRARARGRSVYATLLVGLLSICSISAAQDAGALRQQYTALKPQLQQSAFHRPLYLVSHSEAEQLSGDIYAALDYPFNKLAPALAGIEQWCAVLILHLNVKACAALPNHRDMFSLTIGRKNADLAEAYRFQFNYRALTNTADYLQTVLSATSGPLGTHDYRISFEALRIDARSSFIHLAYAYRDSTRAKLAMRGYLATLGRDKVGFSIVGNTADGAPIYIDGIRGAIERNTMRYYLAIESYLNSLAAAAPLQVELRLNNWFSSSEQYALQLHELTRDDYLSAKRQQLATSSR